MRAQLRDPDRQRLAAGSENNDALALLTAAGGDVTKITYPTSVVSSTDQKNWADEYARFMRGVDVSSRDGTQGIVTHTVAVTGASSDGNYPNFIQGIANYGGGSFHSASNADALLKSLIEIFNEIQSVDSVFAAASLPVSVNARGTFLNQIFMGMFRPDADASPRWRGNLKQYQFGLDGIGALKLVDATGTSAISGTTGFISPSAVSFWTEHEHVLDQPACSARRCRRATRPTARSSRKAPPRSGFARSIRRRRRRAAS